MFSQHNYKLFEYVYNKQCKAHYRYFDTQIIRILELAFNPLALEIDN